MRLTSRRDLESTTETEHNDLSNNDVMPSSTTTTPSKSEALARARAWRDQRCATPPTSSKKQRSTGPTAATAVATKTIKTESKTTPPISQINTSPSLASPTVATNASKQEAKERALARAREFATHLKKKKQQEDNMDVGDDIDVDNGIPAVINVEAGETEDSSGASTTLPAAEEGGEIRRIASEMKILSQQLEAALAKGSA